MVRRSKIRFENIFNILCRGEISKKPLNQEGGPGMKSITLEAIYKKVIDLQRDIAQIKKSLLEEPELREDFILRMRDIDLERSIMIDDFENRYGLQ